MDRNGELRAEKQGTNREAAAQGPQELFVDAVREAERSLKAEVQRHPAYADLWHRLGLLHLAGGDHEAAAGEFEEALGIHPGYRAAYYGLRLAQLFLGQLDPKQEPTAGGADALPEESNWAIVDAAYRCESVDGDSEKVLADLPEPLRYHYGAAFAARRGDEDAAQRHLQMAAETSETSRDLLEKWGIMPWSREIGAEVLSSLNELLWIPAAADLYAFIGRVFARNGGRKEALLSYGRGFMVMPEEATFARHRAEIAIAFGEETEALDYLRQAIEANPTDAAARVALGFEYAAQGYTEEARLQLEVASKLAPKYADVRYNLGLLYMGEGRIENALEQFRNALKLNPSYLPARHSLASLLCRLGHHGEGLGEYRRILKQGFQSADMLVRMGRATLAEGDLEEAVQYLERASFVNPDFPQSYYFLGQVYKQQGLKRKARSAWRRYLEKTNELEGTTLAELDLESLPED